MQFNKNFPLTTNVRGDLDGGRGRGRGVTIPNASQTLAVEFVIVSHKANEESWS